MKILMVNNQHFVKGGAHKVYFNTAELLKNKGHEVFFYSMSGEESLPYEHLEDFPTSVDIRSQSILSKLRTSVSFIYSSKAYDLTIKYLEKVKPDIAHVHLFMGGLTVSVLKAFYDKGIPVVHSVHDYRLICPSYLFLDGNNNICERCKNGFFFNCVTQKCSENKISQSMILALDAYARKYFRKPKNYIDTYVFVSDFIRRKHVEFDKSYEENGVKLFNFIPEIRSLEDKPIRGDYFLFLGRLSREKGVNSLFDAARKSGVKLKIVGDGPLREELQPTKKIEFLGYKSGSELIDLIKNASFIVVPSEWYENNPLSVLEAFSYSKPVIGARIGGIPELVKHNNNGYLFDHGNVDQLSSVLNLANNLTDSEYADYAKSARMFALNNFDPEIHYEKLMKIYQDSIKGNK